MLTDYDGTCMHKMEPTEPRGCCDVRYRRGGGGAILYVTQAVM